MNDEYIVWEKGELPQYLRNLDEGIKELEGESYNHDWSGWMCGDAANSMRYRMKKEVHDKFVEDLYIVWDINELPEEFRDMPVPLAQLEMKCFDGKWRKNHQGTSNKVRRYRMLKTDYERLRKKEETMSEETEDEYGLTLAEAMLALGSGETLIDSDGVELRITENKVRWFEGVNNGHVNLNGCDLSECRVKPPEPINILQAVELLREGKKVQCPSTELILHSTDELENAALSYDEITADWIEVK